ncbi:MAG: protoporphyrinogen oxidase [Frankiales bacterium]|nr:MAG: protoporphyrinogen oxidase [Frankiales bacterium]
MHVAVVGGGITGLAAAYDAVQAGARVTVLEASGRLGGKLAVSEVGGVAVDEGAESLLTRAPDGVGLLRELGLGDELVEPATAAASVWSRGAFRPLPTRTLLGLPTDLAALARSGVLSPRGLARVPLDLVLPGPRVTEDLTVGELVGRRLGREVVERLVDPLLGGVYAGHADRLSVRATLPQLVPHLAGQRSLLRAARAALPAATTAGPPFATLPGGLGRLPEVLAAAAAAEVRLRTTVRELTRTPTGWRLTTGSAAHPQSLDVDAVVLAVPATPAARLLAGLLPTAAAELAGLDYASVALVTLVLDAPVGGAGSGFLVPAVEGRTTKAVTWSSRKWPHLPQRPFVLRGSVGRAGETADLQRSDEELVELVRRDLEALTGPLPRVLDTRVSRWGGSLPQYAVGHLDLVRRVREGVARHPRLAVAGAAYDGVGIPVCIRSGRGAARAVLGQNGEHV